MSEILNQLPNGGAVLAVIVVVMVFLKKQERYDDRMEAIVASFTHEISESRKDYLAQLHRVSNRKSPGRTEE